MHPAAVEQRLLAARGPEVLLAVDAAKQLAEEEMKVVLGGDGTLRRINKAVAPAERQASTSGSP